MLENILQLTAVVVVICPCPCRDVLCDKMDCKIWDDTEPVT